MAGNGGMKFKYVTKIFRDKDFKYTQYDQWQIKLYNSSVNLFNLCVSFKLVFRQFDYTVILSGMKRKICTKSYFPF